MEQGDRASAFPDDSQEWSGVILDDRQVSGHTVECNEEQEGNGP